MGSGLNCKLRQTRFATVEIGKILVKDLLYRNMA
jgi:hypothetical protein